MSTLTDIKTLLQISDTDQDPLLNTIISNVTAHLKVKLGKDVPSELNFIITEIAVRRFNRIGTEGMKSESVEGHSVSFYDLEKEFVPYHDVIDKFKAEDGTSTKRGKVRFL